MKKIVVLGNSLTAIKTLESLKALGADIQATVIAQENTFPYYRHLIGGLAGKKITQNKIFYRPHDEYPSEKINFIFEKKVTRVNFKRSRLTLEDKDQIEYDILLLAEPLMQPFAAVKGSNKTGLYHLKHLSDMTNLIKSLPLVETLVIESNHLAGLKMALAFCQTNKEVILVTSGKSLLAPMLSDEQSLAIQAQVAEAGMRVFFENKITEILGDTQTKAIRLQNAKVFGCQAVLTDIDVPDLRLFKETELQCDQRVVVNESFQTNFENVFAIDNVCDRIQINDWDVSQNYPLVSEALGQIIAAKIFGNQPPAADRQDFIWELEIKGETLKLSAAVSDFSQTPVLRIMSEEKVLTR